MKINWNNLIELICGVLSFVGVIVFGIALNDTQIPLNILLCLFLCLVACLSIVYDIYEKVK